MYCPKCGAELKEGSLFCGKCGASIGERVVNLPSTPQGDSKSKGEKKIDVDTISQKAKETLGTATSKGKVYLDKAKEFANNPENREKAKEFIEKILEKNYKFWRNLIGKIPSIEEKLRETFKDKSCRFKRGIAFASSSTILLFVLIMLFPSKSEPRGNGLTYNDMIEEEVSSSQPTGYYQQGREREEIRFRNSTNVMAYATSHEFKSKRGDVIRISTNGLYFNGVCSSGAITFGDFNETCARINAGGFRGSITLDCAQHVLILADGTVYYEK